MELTDRLLDRFLPYGSPFAPGNRVELLEDGGPYFESLRAAIEQAREQVYLETYILASDETGRSICDLLARRASEGLDVALSFDAVGSWQVDRDFLASIARAGVKVMEYRPIHLGSRPWRARNHRKMLIVDGLIGIIGGMNISNDYAAVEDGGKGWRDTAIWVEGPAVRQLESMFRTLWSRHSTVPLERPTRAHSIELGRPEDVRFVATYSRRDRAEIRHSYLRAIVNARRSIRIVNAYFNPDRGIFRALRRAARRGVSVELILGGATDQPLVLLVSRGLYTPLLKSGVQIFEWKESILHAKTAVIDEEWSTIGSANLNHRMVFNDLEVNAIVKSQRFASVLHRAFERDREKSTRIELEAWRRRPIYKRALEWCFGLFRRLV